jgi:hypothetical protein
VRALKGQAAIANAKLAYRRFAEIFGGERFGACGGAGAHVQRPLWASTSTKNPDYRDVIYVEELIGPDTVNTMPLATVEAFADHGVAARTVDAHMDREGCYPAHGIPARHPARLLPLPSRQFRDARAPSVPPVPRNVRDTVCQGLSTSTCHVIAYHKCA